MTEFNIANYNAQYKTKQKSMKNLVDCESRIKKADTRRRFESLRRN